jgi:AraC-like DNA-binding protein
MNQSVRADLVPFAMHLTMAMKPIAKSEDVNLSFAKNSKSVLAIFHPGTLAADIAAILSKLIEFTPEQERIIVSVESGGKQTCKVVINNTGIDLRRNTEITHRCHKPVTVSGNGNTTRFEIEVELSEAPSPEIMDITKIHGPNYFPDYYAEVRERLRSHFTKAENLVAHLERSNPKEATFLIKVNELIASNMGNSQFDANYLSDAMNMSRTQLFRRLKPIIRQSPGSYLRTIKLHKAKELFEKTDMRISEVAYQTGFESASHFTKMFTKQFGVKPSLFRRKIRNATKEG